MKLGRHGTAFYAGRIVGIIVKVCAIRMAIRTTGGIKWNPIYASRPEVCASKRVTGTPTMHDSPQVLRVRGMLVLLAFIVVASGCSRAKYRIQADREAYDVIAERNADPRWCATDFGIDMDPRSRFFDPYNPDRSPMPADDPTSHQYMQVVDGKKGWSHWDANGERIGLENPAWAGALADYVDVGQDDAVKLNVDSALRLAYMHSPLSRPSWKRSTYPPWMSPPSVFGWIRSSSAAMTRFTATLDH